MRKLLLLVLWFALGCVAFGVPAEGIVYYLEGGTGGGQVHLLSNGRLLRLKFRDGEYREAGPVEWGYGARWKVDYSGDRLKQIHFVGWDSTVRWADQAIRRHYRLLGEKNFAEAYRNLSAAWKKTQSLASFQDNNRAIPYQAGDAPSYAFKVIGHNPNEVVILLDALYVIEGSKDHFRFVLVREDGAWKIDRVDKVAREEFEDA